MQYTDDQLEAIESFKEFIANDNESIMIITGGAGTGKSTVLRALREHVHTINTLQKMGSMSYLYMHITATTNKAVHTLKETFIGLLDINRNQVSEQIKTIYATIGAKLQNGVMVYPKKVNISGKVITVIDEFSYVNEELLNFLLTKYGTPKNNKFLFIGDINQLTPVKSNTMPIQRLIDDERVRLNYLDEIVRQENQKLLDVSYALREFVETGVDIGKGFTPDGSNFVHYKDEEYDLFLNNLKDSMVTSNTKYIAYTNKDVQDMNTYLFKEIKKRRTFLLGDTLVCSKYFSAIGNDGTNYTIKPEQVVILTDVQPATFLLKIVGTITPTSVSGVSVSLLGYPGKTFFVPSEFDYFRLRDSDSIDKSTKLRMDNSWVDLRPEYALTVHKAQGSSYDKVFIDLELFSGIPDDQLSRLLYVACTRAKKELHIIGDI
jgi:ATP-dependent exoDNAse (exonuclease V) alpha subunit